MKTTKDEICDKAMSLFQKQGFEYVSVQDICDACGVTRGSFYHHYKNKNDVLIYWELCHARQEVEQLQQFSGQDPARNLRDYLSAYATEISSMGCRLLYDLIVAMIDSGISTVGSHRGIGVYVGSQPVADLVAQSCGVSQEKAQDLLRYYNMAITGLIIEWKLSDGQFDFVAEADKIAETIFGLHKTN